MPIRAEIYDTLQVPATSVSPLANRTRLPRLLVIGLIPLTAAGTAILHSLQSSVFLASTLLIITIPPFCTGRLRFRTPHILVAVIGVSVSFAYLIPRVRLEPPGQPRQEFTWLLVGLLVVAVCVAAPPSPGVLTKTILFTGTVTAIVARVQGSLLSGRLQGIELNPNYLAVYLATAIVISADLVLSRRNPLWLLPGIICMTTLLSSQSREGFLAVIAGVAFAVIQRASRKQKILLTLITVTAILMFPGDLNVITGLGAGTRSAAELASDNIVRTQVAVFALHVIVTHPLLGIGLGQFPSYAQAFPSFGLYITTTNEYLLLAAETGLASLVALVALLWTALRRMQQGDMAIVRVSLFTSMVAMLFIDLFSNPVVAVPFWACLGTLLAAEQGSRTLMSEPDVTNGFRRSRTQYPH
jgi:hypothetical protein